MRACLPCCVRLRSYSLRLKLVAAPLPRQHAPSDRSVVPTSCVRAGLLCLHLLALQAMNVTRRWIRPPQNFDNVRAQSPIACPTSDFLPVLAALVTAPAELGCCFARCALCFAAGFALIAPDHSSSLAAVAASAKCAGSCAELICYCLSSCNADFLQRADAVSDGDAGGVGRTHVPRCC